jgi:lactoylglutathione lyase
VATKKVTDVGATYFGGRTKIQTTPMKSNNKTPDGAIFDLTHNGWRGAVKEVIAAERERAPAA